VHFIKAEKRSELEAYFAEKRRQIGEPLMPEGFQGETSVELSTVGDLINARGIENSGGNFYAKVAELIFDADISIANLESPPTIAKHAKSGLKMHSTLEQFNVHEQLEAEGFFYVGTNRSSPAQKKALVITVNGEAKTLVSHVNAVQVIQMINNHQIEPYLQLEKLGELIKSTLTECRSADIKEARRYADFVLGKSWRN
jgi:hypothetical protein